MKKGTEKLGLIDEESKKVTYLFLKDRKDPSRPRVYLLIH